ncbi:MAG: hypothetical protein ACYTFW_26410, partial [Planctomycetota bacterium]
MGPQLRFLNNPQYQRALQVYSRFDPTRKAIIDTVIADRQFANEEMRNKLNLLKMGYERERGEKAHKLDKERLGLQKEAFRTSMDLQKRGLDVSSKYADYLSDTASAAETLGWGNIGVSGLRGYAD